MADKDLRPATEAEIQAARDHYAADSDDVSIDEDAQVSASHEGVWVQAWVYLPTEI
jgi:hypothetical protein